MNRKRIPIWILATKVVFTVGVALVIVLSLWPEKRPPSGYLGDISGGFQVKAKDQFSKSENTNHKNNDLENNYELESISDSKASPDYKKKEPRYSQKSGNITYFPNQPIPSEIIDIKLPEVEKIKKQIANNPELTPMALVEYSEKIADAFEALDRSQDNAGALLAKLEECVESEVGRAFDSLHSFCLFQILELSKENPEIYYKYQALKSEAPGSVKKILTLWEKQK